MGIAGSNTEGEYHKNKERCNLKGEIAYRVNWSKERKGLWTGRTNPSLCV